jgi:pimeloyl-ACP methyl ester carboxylesterase
MKNIKLVLGFVMLALQLPLNIFAQPGITFDRDVVFINGLNELGGWDLFSNSLSFSRKLSQGLPNHNSQGGIGGAASQISSFRFGAQSLTIGHSFGGVIARRINSTGQQVIGGIISVGAPLDGAPVANALVDGRATSAISYSAFQMGRGPLATLGFLSPIITLAGQTYGALFLPGKIEDQLDVNKFGGLTTVNDLKVGGGIEQDKNANPTNTPKISIWGNEESPTHWNLATSQSSDNVVAIAQNLSIKYEIAFWNHLTIAYMNFWSPYGWWSYWAAGEWYAGKVWIDYESEGIWNNLIGSDMVVQQCYQYPHLICQYPDTWYCQNHPGAWNCQLTCESIMLTSCVQVHNNGLSDAFIPGVSQRGDGSRSWRKGDGGLITSFEAFGVNHEEEIESTNEEMQSVFRRIFTLQGGLEPVFRIDAR